MQKPPTFDLYKSTNLKLANRLSQQQQYEGYLKRIQHIVDRKYRIDRSPQFYMTFLNKSREKAKQQNKLQEHYLIQLENKHLLEKIQKQKSRKFNKNLSLHQVHMQEKRTREQQKINEENKLRAQRIMSQNSYLIKKKLLPVEDNQSMMSQSHRDNEKFLNKVASSSVHLNKKGISKVRQTDLKFFYSRVKHRKLPKLINTTQELLNATYMR